MMLTEIESYAAVDTFLLAARGLLPSVVLAGQLDHGALFIATEGIAGWSLDQRDVSFLNLPPIPH